MKTKEECLELKISLFRDRINKLEWFFDTIKAVRLKLGGDFYLFDGTQYIRCICLEKNDRDYTIQYSYKHKDPKDVTYIDMAVWDLYLTIQEGLLAEPINKNK